MSLKKMFNPRSIAVIGASSNRGSVGYALFKNILRSSYSGSVYPINVRRQKVQGVKAYTSVLEISTTVDLAIVATPAMTVPNLVRECAKKKIKNIVIISAGFNEIGSKGKNLSDEILEIAKNNNVKIIGPNCLGFINPFINLNASFAAQNAKKGSVAFISQSGAFCTSVLDWSKKNGIGFSKFVSVGSAIDVCFYDLLDYLKDDKKTKSIVIYMESLDRAREFVELARKIVPEKPIFVLKAGASAAGASAAKSHTGALTGNDKVFSVAMERSGVVRLETLGDLFGVIKFLSREDFNIGDNLTIITNAGGPGVVSTDCLVKKGGRLTRISKETIKKLDKVLPGAWSRSNPIDVLGDASHEQYSKTLDICLQDKKINTVLVILTPQSMTEPTKVAKELLKVHKRNKDKLFFVSFIGGLMVEEGFSILDKNNIPVFTTPGDAISAYSYFLERKKLLKNIKSSDGLTNFHFKNKKEANRVILDKLKKENRRVLTELESKEFLYNYGISSPKHAVAKTKIEAEKLAFGIGFPVVMKILSPDILHKTDVGGVVLDIQNKQETGLAFDRIMRSVKKSKKLARIDGVFIEEVVNKKHELLIGIKKDPSFGHVIVFGRGGVEVEVWKDTKMDLLPLSKKAAKKIIQETRISELLKGYRGLPGVDVEKIEEILLKLSSLVIDFPEIKELDINPYSVDKSGGVVLDAKVILG